MKNEKFKKLIKTFSFIEWAATLISSERNTPRFEEIEREISEIGADLGPKVPKLVVKAIDEIENALYQLSQQDRTVYLTRILQYFIPFSAYLGFGNSIEDSVKLSDPIQRMENELKQSKTQSCTRLLIEIEEGGSYDSGLYSGTQNYIYWCSIAYRGFFSRLKDLCDALNIDLWQLQKNLNVELWLREEPLLVESINDYQVSKTDNKKLTHSQIALIYVYTGTQITRENASAIAAKLGWKSKTSGDRLYQSYCRLSSTANRKGRPDPFTKKKLLNKIELLESVIKYIPEDKQSRCIDEINILKSMTEAENP